MGGWIGVASWELLVDSWMLPLLRDGYVRLGFDWGYDSQGLGDLQGTTEILLSHTYSMNLRCGRHTTVSCL